MATANTVVYRFSVRRDPAVVSRLGRDALYRVANGHGMLLARDDLRLELSNGDIRSTPETSRSNGRFRGIMEFC